MKKIIVALALASLAFYSGNAQTLLSKVPADASVVLKYSAENFGKSLPLQKLNSYDFIRHDLFKMMHADTSMLLQDIGIDLEKDGYQYLSTDDSTVNFVTLLQLKNLPQFLRFIKDSSSITGKTQKMNGFEFMSMGIGAYVGWNEKTAVIINSTYNNTKSYYDSPYYTKLDTTIYPMVDTAAAYSWADTTVIVVDKTVKEKKQPAKKGTYKSGKAPVKKKSATAGKSKTPAKKKPAPKVEAPLEEIKEEDDMVTDTYKSYYSPEDSIENMQRELWYQQQEMVKKAKQHDMAVKIANSFFNATIVSIETDAGYKKIVDPTANVSIWVNSGTLWNLYSPLLYGVSGMPRRYFGYSTSTSSADSSKNAQSGYKSAANVYFDKDKLRVEQKTFTEDEKLAGTIKALMNSRQSSSLASYVNPGNIGYFSMSINTEAMISYYYTLMKKYMSSYYLMRDYEEIVDIYIDLLEIAIDEKALAELSPGNFLFVMHDLKPRTVSYTDYTYDDDYNKTEVKRTKKELAPDFTFVMETKKEAFMQKLAQLPLKYAAREKFNYTDKGGYYELVLDSSNLIGNLYFIVKDGKAIVTTSREVVDITLNKSKGFSTESDANRSILDNNYSLKINSSKLMEKLSSEFSTSANKKISDYLIDNIGDVKMESSLKDGMIQSTTTMGIKGKHSNSLEFFFNMVESINNIIENDRHDKMQKLD